MISRTAISGLLVCLASPAAAQATDYGNEDNWLCLPGREDACQTDLTTSVVAPDGSITIKEFTAAEDPGVDCFYVYPTVSMDPTGNSDLSIDPAEVSTVQKQFARFGEVCKLYAPMYRQVTLAGLRAMLSGGDIGADWGLAASDVAAAFGHYMENHNEGRPYVLVGHSQGTIMLKGVIPMMIDGKPAQENLLSAILMGYNIALPENEVVGGELGSIPLCESAEQTGCAVAFTSFKADNVPSQGAEFGYLGQEGMVNACVNPAELLGRETLDSYFTSIYGPTTKAVEAWSSAGNVETPYVSTPGLVSGACMSKNGAQYFGITVNADPEDARTDEIGGELFLGPNVATGWGLHMIDAFLTQGDVIDLIKSQAEAYAAK